MKLSARNQLLLAIRHRSIRWRADQAPNSTPEPVGTWSIDLRPFMTDARLLDAGAELFWQAYADFGHLQVVAPETAVPLLSAILMKSAARGSPIGGITVNGIDGAGGLVEGELADAPIVVIDNLLHLPTRIQSVCAAVAAVGRTITEAFVLIDYRSPETLAWRQASNIAIRAPFSLDDLGLSLASCVPEFEERASREALQVTSSDAEFVGRVQAPATAGGVAHVHTGAGQPFASTLFGAEGVPAGATATNLVRLVDEALPSALFAKLAEEVDGLQLHFGSRSNSRTDPHGHWTTSFVEGGKHNLVDVEPQLVAHQDAQSILQAWNTIREKHLNDHILIRCYVNAHTYGTDGYFHTDSKRSDEVTAVLYLNEAWDPDWGGETVFLDSAREIAFASLPRPNRLVAFRSDVEHAARGVSRKCTTLRKTLVLKARKRRSQDFEAMSAFLCQMGAAKLAHRRGTLHDHLMRTFALLESVGAPIHICRAGALHSIYGTNRFRRVVATEAERPAIAKAFGVDAEQLAFVFSKLDRPQTLEAPLADRPGSVLLKLYDGRTASVPQDFYKALQLIECANLQDQGGVERYPRLSQVWAAAIDHASASEIGADRDDLIASSL